MGEMTDAKFLEWLADRLATEYKESPNADFIHKLRRIAKALPPNQNS